jgi:hypothetical protein
MGTHWEQQKFNTPTLPQNKEKLRVPWVLHATSPHWLQDFIFLVYLWSLPFLTWVNGMGMNYWVYIIEIHII